jgi:condensin-2 complex subunit H2
MVDKDEADLKENRFSYLLQPIRDLAANWDINIAGELEEYLDELENLTFTIEGCAGPSLNFAEAALLIQVCSDVEEQIRLIISVRCGSL